VSEVGAQVAAAAAPNEGARPVPTGVSRRRRFSLGVGVTALLILLAVALPFYLSSFWLQTGVFCFAASIAAMGLNVLVGTSGQLSLANGFFLAVGAYGYCYFAGTSNSLGLVKLHGLGLPPVVAAVLAVLLSGLAGLLFSPIAARLRGIYLGVASIGLIFLGQHLLINVLKPATGGFNGRDAVPFSVLGFSFTDSDPELYVLGYKFGAVERLWYLGLVLTILAALYYRNLLRSRPGRAMQTLRDSEVASAVMGVHVNNYKARAFLVSSMYVGLAGVLLALAFRHVVPDTFGLELSTDYLAMIVLGGLGSVAGSIIGAFFITALPLVLQTYSSSIPFLSAPGQGGIGPSEAARYLYGFAIVLVILFMPGGVASLFQRLGRRPPTAPGAGPPETASVVGSPTPNPRSRADQQGSTG
jgi:branched-chain amino acid transport system permease protein